MPETLKTLINSIAAQFPLLDKSDLSVLASLGEKFEKLASRKSIPGALRTLSQRCASMSAHMIMGEIPFDAGYRKLGEAIEKMVRSASGLPREKSSTPRAESLVEMNRVTEKTHGPAKHAYDETRDLLIKFAHQQRPVLEDFEAMILEREKGAHHAEASLRRILHTWKGEFGVLDLSDYARLMHGVEEALDARAVTTDQLLRLKDMLYDRMNRFSLGDVPQLTTGDIQGILPTQQESNQAPQTPEHLKNESIPTSGRNLFQGDPSLMGDFITESRDHIHTAEIRLLELENEPTNADHLNCIFRSCHTIKGVAGFLGLNNVSELAHAVENIMDLARRGELILTPNHIDVLLESMDCLKALIGCIEDALHGSTFHLPLTYTDVLKKLCEHEKMGSGASPIEGSTKSTGSILVEKGAVTEECVAEALEKQRSGDTRPIGEILIEANQVPAREVGQALARQNVARAAASIEETIRVPVGRLDQLIDAIGEAVIAQSMLCADPVLRNSDSPALERKVGQSSMIMRQIQELSMSLRMVSVKSTFQKMARLVRDLSKKENKEIEFFTEGEDTEIDKSVVENIGDPLIHMIRNSVDHGIETPQERTEAGKPSKGSIHLRAYHKAGNVVIEVEDDGKGLDKETILRKAIEKGLAKQENTYADQEIYQFIFLPGFSTARVVTDVSGRGVGMDVVRKNIAALRGSIDIQTERGQRTKFTIRLPLTLAIINGMVVKAHHERYIVPTLSILESIRPEPKQVETVVQKGEMLNVRGSLLRLVRISDLFHLNGHGAKSDASQGIALVVEDMMGRKTGLLVDDILEQQQVVIKNLGSGMGEIPGVAGGAIMNDGNISLILDVGGIVKMAYES